MIPSTLIHTAEHDAEQAAGDGTGLDTGGVRPVGTLRPAGDVDRPAATFVASRDELLGADTLLGAAELARVACRTSDRTVSVLAVTDERMRRVDAWLAHDAIVTHAMTPDRAEQTVGSVCDRRHATALIGSILDTLLAPLPATASDAAVELPELASLSPRSLPGGVDRLAIVTASGGATSDRWVLAVCTTELAAGLAAGHAGRAADPVHLAPIDVAAARARIRELLGDGAAGAADPVGWL